MTILRHPSSHYDALTQAVAYLGKAEVARLMGKSPDIVDKCINPNVEGYHLPVERALAIDVELARKGFPAVFSLLLSSAVQAALPVTDEASRAEKVETDHEMVGRIVTDAAKVLDEQIAAGKDRVYTSGEKAKLLKLTQGLQKRIATFRRKIFE